MEKAYLNILFSVVATSLLYFVFKVFKKKSRVEDLKAVQQLILKCIEEELIFSILLCFLQLWYDFIMSIDTHCLVLYLVGMFFQEYGCGMIMV